MPDTVFYAWQSDSPNSTNRSFIEDALRRAVKRLRDEEIGDLTIDQGTAGVAGMPEISRAILQKIDSCRAFVGDLTLVGAVDEQPDGGAGRQKRLANSSVMYELGYARSSRGDSRIIGLVNTAYGDVEDLPFDIRGSRVTKYRKHRPKADNDTEPNWLANQLYEGIKAILALESVDDPHPSGELSLPALVVKLKELLPEPTRAIELEALVNRETEILANALVDSDLFPPRSPALQNDVAGVRFVVDQAHKYLELSQRLAAIIALGVAYGGPSHDLLWKRTVERVAGTIRRELAGQTALLSLRSLPLLMISYAGLVAGVHRGRYEAIRAIFIDASVRLNDEEPRMLLAAVDPWRPFDLQVPPTVLAVEASEGPVDDERIQRYFTYGGLRHTPGSDLLHAQLREPLREVIPNDDDYTETFDRSEVFLAVVRNDLILTSDRYVRPYYGAFAWRDRQAKTLEQRLTDQALAHPAEWPPVVAGFFGRDEARLRTALEVTKEGAFDARMRCNG